ncbi:MAG TPA: hypothetical protein VNP04_16230 [Alphaproteobacteria bacterium]|nr:hypothetical protein [Alphaproteobacteria bacterium]
MRWEVDFPMRAFQESPQAAGHREVAATVMTGAFMGGLDTYIVNVALPTIAEIFGADVAMVQWVPLAYLVAITSSLVIVGRAVVSAVRGRGAPQESQPPGVAQ